MLRPYCIGGGEHTLGRPGRGKKTFFCFSHGKMQLKSLVSSITFNLEDQMSQEIAFSHTAAEY
jgi:hypothetical protein